MHTSNLAIRKAVEIGLFSFLLLLAGFAYGDALQEPGQGENVVVLTVENMT